MIIFTYFGGMEAVIWVEVVQLGIYIAGAIAAVNDVGVAVDETGGDPAAFEIHDLGFLDGGCRQFAFGASKGDTAPFSQHGALFDDAETCSVGRQRRKPRISPQHRPDIGGWGTLRKIVPAHQLCAFPYAETCIYIINR